MNDVVGNHPHRASARIGVFAIGLEAYWAQFPGLREGIEQNLNSIEMTVGQWAEVVPGGVVDTARAGAMVGDRFADAGVDLLVCFAGTYATSSQVLPIVQRTGVPLLLLNLQPTASLDYATTDTTSWLASVGVCSIPEIAGVLARSGLPFEVIVGVLEADDPAWDEVRRWCVGAAVARTLRRSRFGMLGHTYPGMIDMSTDVGIVQGQLGAHVEILEIDDLKDSVDTVTDADIAAVIATTQRQFDISGDISREGFRLGGRVAAALDRLADDFALDGLAYYYRGTGGDRIQELASNLILGNTLLTARGIPAAGEGDLKTAIAMKILHELGAGGSFSEFFAIDFCEDFFLMGHDGPAHPGIAAGRPTLKELAVFHGKAGGGLSVEIRAQTGPITILGLTTMVDGELKLIAAEGNSIDGDVLQLGNSNHRVRFGLPVREFMKAWSGLGPTHHVALGLGHRVEDIRIVARLLGVAFETVS